MASHPCACARGLLVGSALFAVGCSATPPRGGRGLNSGPQGNRRPEAPAGLSTSGSVLVLDLRAAGVPESVLPAIGERIATLISERPGFSAVTRADIVHLLEHESDRMLMGCDQDAACLARISELARSKTVVTGSVGKIGAQIVVNLSLLDGRRAATLSKVTATAPRLNAVSKALPGLVADLFGWSKKSQARSRFRLRRKRKTTSFAVLRIEASGVTREVADSLTEVLSSAIKQVPGTTVISRGDVEAMLRVEGDKAQLGCLDDMSCVAEIGGALGVDKLVIGNAGKLAETYIVSLRMIDARRVRVDNRVTESLRGPEDQLIRAVRFAARRLLGVTSQGTGSLAVSADQQQAEVVVDGKLEGTLPMPPIRGLTAGRHSVRLAKGGYLDWESDFFVDPGEATPVWASLVETPEPWYRKWWVWTVVGAALTAGGLAGYYVYAVSSPPPTDGGNFELPR
ncbi:PEGA domain-containing protein [Myxococcota bacterium]